MELYRAYGLVFLSSIFISSFLLHVPATSAAGDRLLKDYPPVEYSPPPPYRHHSPPEVTETCSAAPEEFIDRLLHARRQDCEPIAAECKKVAISRGISDTNCEDCKRKCLNPPHQVTETCSGAPAEFIDKLLHAKREDCERIAAQCKMVAFYRGISDTNCEDCKRKCLNPPAH